MKRVIFVPFTTHEAAAQLIANDSVDTILEAHVAVMKSLLARYPKKITTFSGDKPPYGNTDWWQTSLFFNHAQSQFQDVRIRRAISLYLNRKQAVDYAYQLNPKPVAEWFKAANTYAGNEDADEE